MTPTVGQKIGSLFTSRHPLVTRETARVALGNTHFDNSRIIRKLPGFAFTPLQQTVAAACKQYLEQLQPL